MCCWIFHLIWVLDQGILEWRYHLTLVNLALFLSLQIGYFQYYIFEDRECSAAVTCIQYFLFRGWQNMSRNVRTICSVPSCSVCLVRWWFRSCSWPLTSCWQRVGKNGCNIDTVACVVHGHIDLHLPNIMAWGLYHLTVIQMVKKFPDSLKCVDMDLCGITTEFAVFAASFICIKPYPTTFPYGNGMVLHFYQQQESSTTKTVHKVINKGLKTYV